DDVVVYRLGESSHLLVVNASRLATDWQWVNNRAESWAGVELENSSAEKGMVAVQGPRAEAIVSGLAGVDVAALGYYRCRWIEIAGIEVLLSRNGYTGEDGFEIMCAADRIAALWEILYAAGAKPCGLGARDILRLEMGFCLYGHELDEDTTPLEAGLGWTLNLEKETEFVGAAKLGQLRKVGGYRRLRGFRMLEKGIPRSDYPIVDQRGAPIGRVTSGTQSPILNRGIGLGYLARGAQQVGGQIYIEMRGKKLQAEVVELPFVQAGVKRVD
ncbi:MAG: glycine cleavage system aminomethyltransferase GcvT, partial [Candidatus Latescibacterota bacterium]|nr:glycine cleavage system aminomethyltransferase GcvT [Candidatus Latescibacterota bacterium]